MEEKLYTGKVAIDQFERLIASCHFPEDEHTWVLAERLPDRAVDNTETRQGLLLCTYFKRDILFASYTSGRIFQEDTELRWEKQEGQMHIVYLGSAQFVPALRDYKLRESQALCGLTTQSETRCYYLFGERLQQDDLAKMGG